jgi:hypothetical protein
MLRLKIPKNVRHQIEELKRRGDAATWDAFRSAIDTVYECPAFPAMPLVSSPDGLYQVTFFTNWVICYRLAEPNGADLLSTSVHLNHPEECDIDIVLLSVRRVDSNILMLNKSVG